MTPLQPVKAPWDGVALVCKKCGKKLGGGFGPAGDQSLQKALRTALKATGRRRALRILPVGCLGLCPKRAVTIIAPATPAHLLPIPAGTDPAEILRTLLP